MPHSRTNYIDSPNWDTDSKIESRRDAIILPYREFFGNCLPKNSQHWTICGAHFEKKDEKNTPIKGELGQLLESGLIQDNQFHGVDKEASVINENKKFFPNINWHCSDFLDQMKVAASEGYFNPQIINCDHVMEVPFGSCYLKSILRFIDYNVSNRLLLCFNFAMTNPYKNSEESMGIRVIKELQKNKYLFPKHWVLLPQYYRYRGGANRRSNTIMGTFIFLKNEHDIENIEVADSNLRLDDLSRWEKL